MTAKYRNIQDAEVATDAPITSELVKGLRDNEKAYAEGHSSAPNTGYKFINYDPLPNAEAGEVPIYQVSADYRMANGGPADAPFDEQNVRLALHGDRSNEVVATFGAIKIRRAGIYTGVLRADMCQTYNTLSLSYEQVVNAYTSLTLGFTVNGADTACKKVFRINHGGRGAALRSGDGKLNRLTEEGLLVDGTVAAGGIYLGQQGFKANFFANAGDIVHFKVDIGKGQTPEGGIPIEQQSHSTFNIKPVMGSITGSLHVRQTYSFTQTMADASMQDWHIDTETDTGLDTQGVAGVDGMLAQSTNDQINRSNFTLSQVSEGHDNRDMQTFNLNFQDIWGSGVT